MRSFRCLTSTAIKEIPEVNFENTRPHVTTKTGSCISTSGRDLGKRKASCTRKGERSVDPLKMKQTFLPRGKEWISTNQIDSLWLFLKAVSNEGRR